MANPEDKLITAFIVERVDPKTGLKGAFIPELFPREAEELGITLPTPMILFSCAWIFCRRAHIAIEEQAKQVVYTDETDSTSQLREILRVTLDEYGDPDVNLVMRFVPMCRTLAFRRTLIWNDRFQAWIDSAGRAYDTLTRETPD
jgi:hypothetical protein